MVSNKLGKLLFSNSRKVFNKLSKIPVKMSNVRVADNLVKHIVQIRRSESLYRIHLSLCWVKSIPLIFAAVTLLSF